VTLVGKGIIIGGGMTAVGAESLIFQAMSLTSTTSIHATSGFTVAFRARWSASHPSGLIRDQPPRATDARELITHALGFRR